MSESNHHIIPPVEQGTPFRRRLKAELQELRVVARAGAAVALYWAAVAGLKYLGVEPSLASCLGFILSLTILLTVYSWAAKVSQKRNR